MREGAIAGGHEVVSLAIKVIGKVAYDTHYNILDANGRFS